MARDRAPKGGSVVGDSDPNIPKGNPVPDGWEEVQTNRPYYNVEKCRQTPLQGFLLNLQDMPPNEFGGAWKAFIVKATAEVMAVPPLEAGSVANAAAEPTLYQPGTEILIPSSVKLKQALDRYLHKDRLFEVRIVPTNKVSLGPDRDMWLFTIHANPRTIQSRPAHLPLIERKRTDDGIPF